MTEEPDNPKRDLGRYVFCAILFFGMTLMTHPVVQSFFWVNLAVAIYCVYKALRAAVKLL